MTHFRENLCNMSDTVADPVGVYSNDLQRYPLVSDSQHVIHS